ncbi:hypothetical protein M3M38_06305 [Fructilactobacillus cliffordii]|uniref:hypothetical protein n=1 Tax=Fructilactobacillus cliffordii TaxID=2940299 RepID=UPI002092A43E|nr:hypothetical protein [Fructilactobacillus cliffordii]USS86296.1 hypothetical protein M3M38_06305 [Fructilactobacillus cliffordii]
MFKKFYAVGWQSEKNGGIPKDFRIVDFKSGLENFIDSLEFSGFDKSGDDIIEYFNYCKSQLNDLENNGNDTDEPFFRTLNNNNNIEFSKIKIITNKINQDQNYLSNFDGIRFYILNFEDNEKNLQYRFYIKAVRTAKINSRFVLSRLDHKFKITDLKSDGKVMPSKISYAEVMDKENNSITQYVFNVSDYESIFGLNEIKVKGATNVINKFVGINNSEKVFLISNNYKVNINDIELNKIYEKINDNRRLANALYKYNNEAENYKLDDVKLANETSKQFFNNPFTINEESKTINVTSDSFETFVSVITNLTKLGIAAHDYENKIAPSKKK